MNTIGSKSVFTWFAEARTSMVTRYRLFLNVLAAAYLYYFVFTGRGRGFAIAAITVLLGFAFEDIRRFLYLRGRRSARSVSGKLLS